MQMPYLAKQLVNAACAVSKLPGRCCRPFSSCDCGTKNPPCRWLLDGEHRRLTQTGILVATGHEQLCSLVSTRPFSHRVTLTRQVYGFGSFFASSNDEDVTLSCTLSDKSLVH